MLFRSKEIFPEKQKKPAHFLRRFSDHSDIPCSEQPHLIGKHIAADAAELAVVDLQQPVGDGHFPEEMCIRDSSHRWGRLEPSASDGNQ